MERKENIFPFPYNYQLYKLDPLIFYFHNNLIKNYLSLDHFTQNKILHDNLIPNKIMSLPNNKRSFNKKNTLQQTNRKAKNSRYAFKHQN